MQPVASYRLPLSQGRLNIPGGAGCYNYNALISGSVIVTANAVLFEIDFGPSAFTIADAAGVEIVNYADETLYHGAAASLIALGIERSRLPLKKKAALSDRGWMAQSEEWSSRRQPDGLIVHRVESPAALRRRRERWEQYGVGNESKPADIQRCTSHLRLVIDNTQESGVDSQ